MMNMTVSELLADEMFNNKVKDIVTAINGMFSRHSFKNIPDNGMVRLYKDGRLNPEYVLEEIPNVINKTSTLPAVMRDAVNRIAKDAAAYTLIQRNKEAVVKDES